MHMGSPRGPGGLPQAPMAPLRRPEAPQNPQWSFTLFTVFTCLGSVFIFFGFLAKHKWSNLVKLSSLPTYYPPRQQTLYFGLPLPSHISRL